MACTASAAKAIQVAVTNIKRWTKGTKQLSGPIHSFRHRSKMTLAASRRHSFECDTISFPPPWATSQNEKSSNDLQVQSPLTRRPRYPFQKTHSHHSFPEDKHFRSRQQRLPMPTLLDAISVLPDSCSELFLERKDSEELGEYGLATSFYWKLGNVPSVRILPPDKPPGNPQSEMATLCKERKEWATRHSSVRRPGSIGP